MSIMPLFPTTFETVLFVSVIVLWIMFEVIDAVFILKVRHGGGPIKRDDKGSNLFLRLSLYVSLIVAFLLAINTIAVLPDWLFYPGVVLMVAGILVRQWAFFTLGRFFTLTVSVQENQKVVDNGPYRFIRHPSYSGMFLTVTGIGVALQSWAGTLVIAVLAGLAIGYRIRIEEKFLISELGDDYIRYMKRTKRLIPFVV
ncbi:MAG TPA: isoprenylcysteine carboxylmethyltransferase family protein [Methanoregulaceae archaeon]|nr:isoprenylcysteine carboxylmethyltransferase family protein [Methanoregulaceae archaeon]